MRESDAWGLVSVIFYAFGIQHISGTLLAIRYLAFEVVSSTNQLNTLLGRLIIFVKTKGYLEK